MADYKSLYFRLFNKMTDIFRQLSDLEKEIVKLQIEAEEIIISSEEQLVLLDFEEYKHKYTEKTQDIEKTS